MENMTLAEMYTELATLLNKLHAMHARYKELASQEGFTLEIEDLKDERTEILKRVKALGKNVADVDNIIADEIEHVATWGLYPMLPTPNDEIHAPIALVMPKNGKGTGTIQFVA